MCVYLYIYIYIYIYALFCAYVYAHACVYVYLNLYFYLEHKRIALGRRNASSHPRNCLWSTRCRWCCRLPTFSIVLYAACKQILRQGRAALCSSKMSTCIHVCVPASEDVLGLPYAFSGKLVVVDQIGPCQGNSWFFSTTLNFVSSHPPSWLGKSAGRLPLVQPAGLSMW